jgi:hypothetical protein
MKHVKITASNHDKSKSELTLIRIDEKDARRTIKLMRDCGYQTIQITNNQGRQL